MGQRGRIKDVAGRRQDWTLILGGMHNAEASRAMGRHPRHCLRWKHEYGGRVPPGVFRSGRYLGLDERWAIADLRREGGRCARLPGG